MDIKWITKLVVFAIFAIGITSIASAQGAGPTGGGLTPGKSARQGQKHPLLDALSKLDLTPDQKTKLRALETARNDDVKAFRKAHKGDTAAIREHAAEATKTFLTGIKGVLTPAQWEQFQQALKDMRKAGNKGNGAAPPQTKSS